MTSVLGGGFGLKVQLLDRQIDQVLVLARVAELRNGGESFSRAEVDALFEGLKIPTPKNSSQALSNLRGHRPAYVTQRTERYRWSVTPAGRHAAEDVIGGIDPQRINAELAPSIGSEFNQARHLVIPPMFAPPRWDAGISRLIDDCPFETNVFLMTRYPADPTDEHFLDPIAEVISTIDEELSKHGLNLQIASARQAEDDLLGNVAAHMWACRYGIGLLEDRVNKGVNDNVILEVGAMLMTGRRCALLKDKRLDRKNIPTDLVGQIYKSVNFSDTEEVRDTVASWISDDLGIG